MGCPGPSSAEEGSPLASVPGETAHQSQPQPLGATLTPALTPTVLPTRSPAVQLGLCRGGIVWLEVGETLPLKHSAALETLCVAFPRAWFLLSGIFLQQCR